jgi:septation ring formation regulator EzrA
MWTQATLQDLRERKVKAEEIAVECMERLKEETRKMEETNNPLMKAMHFRNGTLCLSFSYRVCTL